MMEITGIVFFQIGIEAAADPVDIRRAEGKYIIIQQSEIQKTLFFFGFVRQIRTGRADHDQPVVFQDLQCFPQSDGCDIEMPGKFPYTGQFGIVKSKRNDFITDMHGNLLILVFHIASFLV